MGKFIVKQDREIFSKTFGSKILISLTQIAISVFPICHLKKVFTRNPFLKETDNFIRLLRNGLSLMRYFKIGTVWDDKINKVN